MTFPNFPSPHIHIQSLDSASTPQAFVEREKELGTGTITCTDHGSMACCRKVYDLAKKNGLTPILGVEAYFRDDNCPIITAAGLDPKTYRKYFHITLHAMDQKAYEMLARVLSNASINRFERHGSENKPLFNWADLEELAKYNVTFTTGCLIGMIQGHYLLGREDLAEAYLAKMKSFVPAGNLYVEVFPHHTDKNWVSGIFITLDDGTKLKWYGGKKLLVDGDEITAEQLAKDFKANDKACRYLEGVKNRNTWERYSKPGLPIFKVEHVEDFIENECMPGATDSDSQKWTNYKMVQLAEKNDLPVLISDDAHFATPDEKVVQDVRLMSGGGAWRFYASYHRFSSDEAYSYFNKIYDAEQMDEFEFSKLIQNNVNWAARFKEFKFEDRRELPTKFYPPDTLAHIQTLIRKHGRMNWDRADYRARLDAEIKMLKFNGVVDLLPYFMIDEEVTSLYQQNGLLTGPGRGSAAGLLLSYLLGITHVDPLKYDLSMERFLTEDRIKNGKWPDIDQDLPHRDLLVNPMDPNKGWLADRFQDCFAQISTDTGLKLRSSIKDISRVKHGKVLPAVEALTKNMENAPQGVGDHDFIFGYEGPGGWVDGSIERDRSLQAYIETYPAEWALVQKLLGLSRQKSRHACGFVITNSPIANFIPLTKIGEYTVTQYDAKSVEAAGGLKMDFLVINVLNDISEALKLIALRNNGPVLSDRMINGRMVPAIRQIPFGSEIHDIWDLPVDNSVYADICRGDTETVFQLNTNTARPFLRLFNFQRPDGTHGMNSILDLAAFTALGRPGPLDAMVTDGKRTHNMLVEFANRAAGKEAIGSIKVLDELLPETYGVIVYQEQLQKIFQKLGKTTAVEADEFRVHIGKKMMAEVTKDREVFMAGAVKELGQEMADRVWSQMFTFGQYGFNKSHAVCYVIIAYACAFLKRHFPLEWWTAILRNADRNEIDEKYWRHCGHLVILPDMAKSTSTFTISGDKIQAPLSLLHGIGAKAHEWLVSGAPYENLEALIQNERNRRLAEATVVPAKEVKPAKRKKKEPVVAPQPTMKLGHSPLHRGVISTLIISGTMDSLFAPDDDVYTKLQKFEQLYCQINNKKAPRVIDEKLLGLNRMMLYQMRKKILPAYAEPMIPMLNRKEGVTVVNDTYYYNNGKDAYRIVSPYEYERLDSMQMLPRPITVAIPAYILASRKFKYQNGEKEACELMMDHSGMQIKAVKWGSRESGKLPKGWKDDLTGCIAIVLMNKWNESKPFGVESIEVVQEALVDEEPEESA